MKTIEITGQKFGMFTVLGRAENRGKNTAWKCVCECGNEKDVLTYNLISGKSKSCGCARITTLKRVMTKHGGRKTRIYGIFKGMCARCYNDHNPAYHYYGGKGVKICDEWKNDFAKFREWSFENGYDETSSIDRINPNGGYCPENCRWVSPQKQQNNKLNSAFLTIDGEKLTICEWAEKTNTNKQTLHSKFHRLLNQLSISNATTIEFEIRTNREKVN